MSSSARITGEEGAQNKKDRASGISGSAMAGRGLLCAPEQRICPTGRTSGFVRWWVPYNIVSESKKTMSLVADRLN
ncbi:hypothetical protein, partial [Acetobacter syzygii]|uniref:hypothetical protein n=1 Tax=Acetobacter syzygii TaxID=146476 RepID=UPI0039EA1CCA